MSASFPTPFSWNFCGTCGDALTVSSDGERMRPYCRQCNRHYYLNPVPACCIFVRDSDGRLLFGKRAVEPCLGAWALPGGFMELNESGEQCALREMLEETGLSARRARLLGASATQSKLNGGILVLGYLIEEWEGELSPDSDVSDLCFFHRVERPEVPFEAHRELIALYDTLFP